MHSPHFDNRLTQYMKHVLERTRLGEVKFSSASLFLAVTSTQLKQGKLSKEDTDKLFAEFAKKNSNKSPQAIDVVVSLLTLHTPDQSAAHQGLVLVSASLDKSGKIEPKLDSGSSPWIPATRLTMPRAEELEVMLGSLESFGEFSRRYRASLVSQTSENPTMPDAMKVAKTLIEHQLDSAPKELAENIHGRIEAQQIEQDLAYIQLDDRIFAAQGLVDLHGQEQCSCRTRAAYLSAGRR